jgi:hypothetical protein
MATYKVVKHPTLGFEAIKQGFNFFAFFLSFIWAAFKGLWQKAIILFVVVLILVSIENSIRLEGSETGLVLTLLVQLAFCIYVGRNANNWTIQRYIDRGFTDMATVESPTADAAIAEVANQE